MIIALVLAAALTRPVTCQRTIYPLLSSHAASTSKRAHVERHIGKKHHATSPPLLVLPHVTSGKDVSKSNLRSGEAPRELQLLELNDKTIFEAVDAYLDNRTQAETVYGRLTKWKTAKVTDMTALFSAERNPLASTFNNRGVDNWNVERVTSMRKMFEGALQFNKKLVSWKTNSLTSIAKMFLNAKRFNQPLAFNTSLVVSLRQTFMNASRFNQRIAQWDIAEVTTLHSTFKNAGSFAQNLNNWNLVKVLNTDSMFESATLFDGIVSAWTVGSVTNMRKMFCNAKSFSRNVRPWNVERVKSTKYMFKGAISFASRVDSWNVGRVTNMSGMFQQTNIFNSALSGWQVVKVRKMNFMFAGALGFNKPLATWTVTKVSGFNKMFSGAEIFNQDLCSWGADIMSNAVVFQMFQGSSCPRQENPDVALVLAEPLCHTCVPSMSPSSSPTASPSFVPSLSPSGGPSVAPTASPSFVPSLSPSGAPSVAPSTTPSLSPSSVPTLSPSLSPSSFPSTSSVPSSAPTCINENELFDPIEMAIDGSLWSTVTGGSLSNECGTGSSFSSTTAYRFNAAIGAVARLMETRDIDTLAACSIRFDIQRSVGACDVLGLITGEEVHVRYSIDGGANWIEIFEFPAGAFDWMTMELLLPGGAKTAATRFRVVQDTWVSNYGRWAIDNVYIGGV